MTTYYKIHDGLIDEKTVEQVFMVLFGWHFPWTYYANTNYSTHQTQEDDVPQFTHGFMRDGANNSKLTSIPLEIVKPFGLGFTDMYRAKANLVGWEKAPRTHPPHTDDDMPHFVILYYVNDSDGDTVIYLPDGDSVSITPKKGRVLAFDGSLKHASSSPVETRYRVVININIKAHIPRSVIGLE